MQNLITPWRSVAAVFVLNGLLLGCWAARVPAFVDRLDLSEATLGSLLLIMGIGAMISFPLMGRLSDHLGAYRVVRWLSLFYLLTIVAVGVSGSVIVLAITLFFFGIGHGGLDVAMNTWATEVERKMGRSVMSSFHAMWSLGAGTGAAGGFLATQAGLDTGLHFLLAAVISALFVGPFLTLDWRSEVQRPEGKAPLFALPHGALILVGLMAMGAGFGEGAAVDWSAVYLTDVLMTSEAQATLAYTAFSITMVVMRLVVDRIVGIYGPRRVARISGVMAGIGYALCAVTNDLPVALVGYVFMGIGYAAIVPLAFSRAANDPYIPSGQAIASIATLGYGSMLLGPPAIGFIAQVTSLRLSFAMVAGFALLIALLARSLDPKT